MTLGPVGIMVIMIMAARYYQLDESTHRKIVSALADAAIEETDPA
jgi:Na+/melibiose symporter-like transporter